MFPPWSSWATSESADGYVMPLPTNKFIWLTFLVFLWGTVLYQPWNLFQTCLVSLFNFWPLTTAKLTKMIRPIFNWLSSTTFRKWIALSQLSKWSNLVTIAIQFNATYYKISPSTEEPLVNVKTISYTLIISKVVSKLSLPISLIAFVEIS